MSSWGKNIPGRLKSRKSKNPTVAGDARGNPGEIILEENAEATLCGCL